MVATKEEAKTVLELNAEKTFILGRNVVILPRSTYDFIIEWLEKK